MGQAVLVELFNGRRRCRCHGRFQWLYRLAVLQPQGIEQALAGAGVVILGGMQLAQGFPGRCACTGGQCLL